MRLLLLHPEVACRSCEDCKKWLYDKDGRLAMRGDKPMDRPATIKVVCETAAGCPKGTPEKQVVLSRKNQTAYYHYRQCAAVGKFPDDGIVMRNAEIIKSVIDEVREMRELRLATLRHG